MRDTIQKLKLATVAFLIILKNKKHVFLSDDFISVNAPSNDLLDYCKDIKELVEVCVDESKMNSFVNDVKVILKNNI